MREYISIKTAEYEELKRKAQNAVDFFRENQILHSENVLASQIQRGMLPGEKGLYSDVNVEIYGDMDAAKEVGGDFYDVIKIDSDSVFVCIGDVSGKGIPAIIHMVACKVLIRNKMRNNDGDIDLGSVFSDINRELFQLSEKKQFVTCFAGIYDMRTGCLRYINAGHTKSLICNGKKMLLIDNVSGMPLGAYYSEKKKEHCCYKEYQAFLNEGDILFMYTDGCTEAMNDKDDIYGLTRLQNVVNSYADKLSLADMVTYLQRRIYEFENHEEQDDDLTILALKVKRIERIENGIV